MNQNTRIARELVRLARILVADKEFTRNKEFAKKQLKALEKEAKEVADIPIETDYVSQDKSPKASYKELHKHYTSVVTQCLNRLSEKNAIDKDEYEEICNADVSKELVKYVKKIESSDKIDPADVDIYKDCLSTDIDKMIYTLRSALGDEA